MCGLIAFMFVLPFTIFSVFLKLSLLILGFIVKILTTLPIRLILVVSVAMAFVVFFRTRPTLLLAGFVFLCVLILAVGSIREKKGNGSNNRKKLNVKTKNRTKTKSQEIAYLENCSIYYETRAREATNEIKTRKDLKRRNEPSPTKNDAKHGSDSPSTKIIDFGDRVKDKERTCKQSNERSIVENVKKYDTVESVLSGLKISSRDFLEKWETLRNMERSACYVICTYGWDPVVDFTKYQEVYVGQSKTAMKRVRNHLTGHGNGDVYCDVRNGKMVYVKIIPCEQERLNDLEKELISAMRAKESYNKTAGGSATKKSSTSRKDETKYLLESNAK